MEILEEQKIKYLTRRKAELNQLHSAAGEDLFLMAIDIGLRVWGGYVMGGELDPEKDKNVDAKFKDAKGYRVGAGIKLGIASLNLEYQDLKYGTTEIEEAGVFTPGSNYNDVNLKNKSFILSVSFPIAI